MVDIRNPQVLNAILEQVVKEVIEEVSEKVLKEVQKNIKTFTYGSHGANKWYLDGTKRPSGQFLESFELTQIRKEANSIVQELWYNWQKMSYDPDIWMHGSNVKGWYPDARQFLADFLNKDGLSSSLPISVEHQPFWEISLRNLFEQGQIQKWFDEAFASKGIRK